MASPYALLLDDDEVLRTRLRDALAGQGWQVRGSARSRAASLLVAWRRPDVVLLDVSEPTPTARALATDLRIRYGPALPIVATTGESTTPLLEQVKPYSVVKKPPHVERLLAILKQAQSLSLESAVLRARSREVLERTRQLRSLPLPRF
ncbi:MAG: hypothetical protein JO247_24365 [Chloroflexi bacterium]|nr:hypothetical protein [Chloroflexota bacterium]